jgi:septal ring factor EnvC (AmiA/AmiB activator)
VADPDPVTEELKALKIKHRIATEENSKLSEALEKAFQEKGSLKKDVITANARLQVSVSKVAQLEKVIRAGALEERMKERDSLRKQLSEAQRKMLDLQKDVSGRDERVADRVKEVVRLQQKISHLESTAETMQVARDAAQKRAAEVQAQASRAAGLEAEAEKSAKLVAMLEKECEALKASRSNATKAEPMAAVASAKG